MTSGIRHRGRFVAACAFTYPLVWAGAGLIAFVAGVTSDVETDTKGLGDAIAGFILGAAALNLLWAVAVFVGARRHGRTARSAVAALGIPAAVIAGMIEITRAGVALGLVLPLVATWWATTPRNERGAASPRASGPSLLS